MEEEQKKAEDSEGTEKEKKKKAEEKLPYCTTAPSAEHARGNNDNEPCDDGRTGDVD